jgi:hypothetical protein
MTIGKHRDPVRSPVQRFPVFPNRVFYPSIVKLKTIPVYERGTTAVRDFYRRAKKKKSVFHRNSSFILPHGRRIIIPRDCVSSLPEGLVGPARDVGELGTCLEQHFSRAAFSKLTGTFFSVLSVFYKKNIWINSFVKTTYLCNIIILSKVITLLYITFYAGRFLLFQKYK